MIGEDLSALPLFDNELDTVTIYDSEDDQIIQYADSNAPLNYKEMPTSVCDSKIILFLLLSKHLQVQDKDIFIND